MLASQIARLLTTPANVPAMSARGSFRHRRSVLRVDYVTDADAARILLPEPLQMPAIPRASIYLTQYHDMFSDRPIIEVAQAIEAVSPSGVIGDFVQAVYTDSIPALVGNREAYLQPVLYGSGSIRHRHAVTDFALRINDVVVLQGSAGYKSEPIATEDAADLFMRPKFFLKVLGSPLLGEPPRPTLFSLQPAELDITEAHRAPSRVNFFPHVMAPLDDLPIKHIQTCHHVETNWTVGTAQIVHQYAR